MITFKELDAPLANKIWEKFAPYHYDYKTSREKLANNSRRYLAVEDGVVLGFAAIHCHFGRTNKGAPPCWRSHKIVTLPQYVDRWGDVSDAMGRLVAQSGLEYRCKTPIAFATYRENNPRWRKIAEKGPRGAELSSWLFLESLK